MAAMPYPRSLLVLAPWLAILIATSTLGSRAIGAEPSATDAAEAEPARAERARAAAEKVLSDPRYQRTRPDGSLASPPPDRPPRPPREPRAPSRFEPSQASGVSTALLWVIGGVLGAGLLLILGRELLLAQRRRRRKKPRGGGESLEQLIIDSHVQALPASLARARELAAAGRFDEAAHELLSTTMGYLRALAGFSLEPSYTSREVLAKAPLDPALARSLGELVLVVEVSLFGERQIGEPEYLRCERAFLHLHNQLGHGA